jgi:poly(A) polymerase
LLPNDAEAVADTAAALRLSNAQRARLLEALPGSPPVSPDMGPVQARAAIAALGGTAFRDQLLLSSAGQSAVGDLPALLALADGWSPPPLPVTGRDLQAAGLAPGPELGRSLKALERAWIDSDFTLDRQALLDQLRS